MLTDSTPASLLDGRPSTHEDLVPLAFAGHAHFTAMQVRGGRIAGLDRHLERLRGASLALFGTSLPDELVAGHLRTAIALAGPDMSLTVTVFTSAGEFTYAASPSLHTLVRASPPAPAPEGPLRLYPFEHERFLPELKLVGESAKTYALHEAVAAGFDDAVFVDRSGALTEASIWNLAFYDGDSVVWPRGRLLEGTTQRILRRRLGDLGVGQRLARVDPARVRGMSAVVMNSWTPGVPVTAIGNEALEVSAAFIGLLREAWDDEPVVAP